MSGGELAMEGLIGKKTKKKFLSEVKYFVSLNWIILFLYFSRIFSLDYLGGREERHLV